MYSQPDMVKEELKNSKMPHLENPPRENYNDVSRYYIQPIPFQNNPSALTAEILQARPRLNMYHFFKTSAPYFVDEINNRINNERMRVIPREQVQHHKLKSKVDYNVY